MTNMTYKGIGVAARFVLLVVAALVFSGCWQAHQLDSLCDEIAEECPGAHFTRDFSVSLGPFSMGLIRFATGFSEDTREARDYLSGVSRIQIAVYKVSSVNNAKRLKLPQQMREMIEDDGWEMVVKASERDESTWILFHEDDGKIRDMMITALDREELVMVRVSGHLNELFEKAMKEHGSMGDLVHSKFGKLKGSHAAAASDDSPEED